MNSKLNWKAVSVLLAASASVILPKVLEIEAQNYISRETYNSQLAESLSQENLDRLAEQCKTLPINHQFSSSGAQSQSPTQTLEEIIEQSQVQMQTQNVQPSMDDYIDTIIQIESGGNPNASRYEAHIDDTSYGLGQLLTKTAKDLESRHPELPRLGKTPQEIKANLTNPKINRQYTQALFTDEMIAYDEDPRVAVAAYNAGHYAPVYARCQEQLNDLYKINLTPDGSIGPESPEG